MYISRLHILKFMIRFLDYGANSCPRCSVVIDRLINYDDRFCHPKSFFPSKARKAE